MTGWGIGVTVTGWRNGDSTTDEASVSQSRGDTSEYLTGVLVTGWGISVSISGWGIGVLVTG